MYVIFCFKLEMIDNIYKYLLTWAYKFNYRRTTGYHLCDHLGHIGCFFAYVMIKVKSQRNPPKWLFCEQFYIAYTYLLTCRSLFIIFTFVWKWNRMPSWGYIKSLSFVLWTEQRVVNTLCISRSLMKNIS